MALQNPNLEICNVISESRRIASSQKRHLTALSLLFVFPLSLCTIILVAFEKTTIISILLALFAIIFFFCAVSTITYTSFHGYNGQHIDLSSILFSIPPLFLPFLSTVSLLLSILALISTCLGLLFVLIYKGILLIVGFDMKLNSSYFVISYVSVMIVIGILLDMKWMLANVIMVVEGKKCYEPLRRSAYLLKGLKWGQIFPFQLLVVAPLGLCLWYCAAILPALTAGLATWLDYLNLATQLVYYSGFLTLMLLGNLVRNVIMYVQCKALTGELLEVLPI